MGLVAPGPLPLPQSETDLYWEKLATRGTPVSTSVQFGTDVRPLGKNGNGRQLDIGVSAEPEGVLSNVLIGTRQRLMALRCFSRASRRMPSRTRAARISSTFGSRVFWQGATFFELAPGSLGND